MKYSIITVCKNMGVELEESIKSVRDQSCSDFEYIIVDGKSTDSTDKIVGKYRKYIDKYICEKDGGIYEAMNKAIKKARGEYLFFLNAGDTFFVKDTLKKVAVKSGKVDLVYGNVVELNSNGERLNKFDKVDKWFLIKNAICHQAMFIKKELFAKYGDYDPKYKIAADYEWLLRVWGENITKKYMDINVSRFLMGGKSNGSKYRGEVLREYGEIRNMYFSKIEILRYRIYEQMVRSYQKIFK